MVEIILKHYVNEHRNGFFDIPIIDQLALAHSISALAKYMPDLLEEFLDGLDPFRSSDSAGTVRCRQPGDESI
jgi:hypothetical protein